MPGPAIIAAVIATTFVLTTQGDPRLSKEEKAACAHTVCSMLTTEQLEEIYQAGFKAGVQRTTERMSVSCLKDAV